MGITQTFGVGWTFFPQLRVVVVAMGLSPVVGVIPDNQIQSLPTGNVVRTMSVPTQMQDSLTNLVLVGVPVEAMIWISFSTAQDKS